MITIGLLGDAGTGKSSFVKKIIGENFNGRYLPTTGKKVTEFGDIRFIEFSGAEKYQTRNFDGISAFIIFFDCTSISSFKNLAFWRSQISVPFKIVGTKYDIPDKKILDARYQESKEGMSQVLIDLRNEIVV